jgi:hypothetical protein
MLLITGDDVKAKNSVGLENMPNQIRCGKRGD